MDSASWDRGHRDFRGWQVASYTIDWAGTNAVERSLLGNLGLLMQLYVALCREALVFSNVS